MGKQVVSREEFLARIRAAVIARDSIPGGSDFVSVDLALLRDAYDLVLTILDRGDCDAVGYHRPHGLRTSARYGGGDHPP